MANTPYQITPELSRRQATYSVISVTLSPAEVAANTSAEQTFTVTGLKAATAATLTLPASPGDHIAGVCKPTAQAGIGIVGARVSADDTLALTFMNTTAGAITPTASQTYTIGVLRQKAVLTTVDG